MLGVYVDAGRVNVRPFPPALKSESHCLRPLACISLVLAAHHVVLHLKRLPPLPCTPLSVALLQRVQWLLHTCACQLLHLSLYTAHPSL